MRRAFGALTFYNGWSPEERRATLPIQRAALKAGEMASPERCSICGFDGSSMEDGNRLELHDERYDEPLSAYPICRRCHRILHARFERPARWKRLVAEFGDGSKWFEYLSLDPQSQWRPFDETYQNGFPMWVKL